MRDDGAELDLTIEFVDDPPAPPTEPPLATWAFREAEQFTTALYRHDDGYAYATGAGVTLIDPAHSRIRIPSGIRGALWEEHLWGVPAILCFLARGDLPLHAAAVEVDGGAVLLAAPGHHGKTTLALALHNAGHRVLAEDLTCWRRDGNDIVAVPGPAMLRARPDVLEQMPIDDADVIYRHPSRTYLSVASGRRGSGRPVPVRGVVFLRIGDGPVRVERIPAPQALPDLWALCFKISDAQFNARVFDGLVGLAASVPIWNIHRPLQFQALDATIDAVRGLARDA
jgi:hypothetical protein